MRTTSHPLRKLRRDRAAARQIKRDARSTTEQLALISQRRGESKREAARLSA